MTLFEDRDWPRAAHWLESGKNPHPNLSVVGVTHQKSITPGHAEEAPQAIRSALLGFSTYHPDHDVDLLDLEVRDWGDFGPADLPAIEGPRVYLGGDNAITRFCVPHLGLPLAKVAVLTFDAHLDVRNLEKGAHNGNPIRGLLEAGLPGENVVQVGLLPFANSKAYVDFARERGLRGVTVAQVRDRGIAPIVQEVLADFTRRGLTVYVDLDVDVLDAAFTPGTPGARPGGLFPDEVATAAYLCGADPAVMAMDLVEIDPRKDVGQASCRAAARFFLEFAVGVVSRGRQ